VEHTRPPDARRALVLVDHGSREAAANQQLESVAERLRRRLDGWIVRVAHLEIAAPSLEEALSSCVAEGAREIVVHPYFLADGRHARRDVPRQAQEAAARHPGVHVVVTPPLGLHPGLLDAVIDRVRTAASCSRRE